MEVEDAQEDGSSASANAATSPRNDAESTNPPTGPSPPPKSQGDDADADTDAYGNEVKCESDDEGLLRKEKRRLHRLDAEEARREENEAQNTASGSHAQGEQYGQDDDGDGDEGNNAINTANATNNASSESDDLDEDEEAYAAILDPLHGYECPEPDYTVADALPFPTLVKRFETLSNQRKRHGNRQPKEQLLEHLLPRKLLDEHLKGCSIYPLLRLILPDCDVARGHLGMKEKSIANAWAAAMGFAKDSSRTRSWSSSWTRSTPASRRRAI
jgi:hypothetical protein